MKNRRQNAVLFAAAIILITFAVSMKSIRSIRSQEPAVTSVPPQTDTADLYLKAVDKTLSTGSYQMEISSVRETDLGNQVLREFSEKTISCRNYGTDDVEINVAESVQSGPHNFSVSERYKDGRAYLTLEDSHFSAEISQQDYMKRLPSVALMDPSLYRNVEVRQQDTGVQIGFLGSSEPESWAAGENAKVRNASGNVLIDSEGNLTESGYTLIYEAGSAHVTELIHVKYVPVQMDAFTPVVPREYVTIPSIDIPCLLEKSTGYLLQAEKIHSEMNESITSEAGNLSRNQHTSISVDGLGENLQSQIDSDVELIDFNQGGTSTKYKQSEQFKDGIYSLTVTEGTAPDQPEYDITQDVMKKYIQDMLVSSIVLPQYIASISLAQSNEAYILIFTGSHMLSDVMGSDACMVLYQDSNMLDSISASYRSDETEATLLLNKQTMLPMSSSISYSGNHTINGTPYKLSSQISQTYSFE